MCSVGDGFNVEISEGVDLKNYKCNDCGKEFKGLSLSKVKCPACHSINTIQA